MNEKEALELEREKVEYRIAEVMRGLNELRQHSYALGRKIRKMTLDELDRSS